MDTVRLFFVGYHVSCFKVVLFFKTILFIN